MTDARGDMTPEFQPLGKKIERKPETPAPSKRAPDPPPAWGIKIGPDGKWETDLPKPKTPP